MKTYILYNPLAGTGTGKAESEKLAATLEGDTIMQNMTEITDYQAFFAPLCAEDTVILCGGDGTLNRFVNDTAELSIPCELLYYAVGTGNDFLKDIEKNVGDAPFPVGQYLQELPTVSSCAEELHISPNYLGDIVRKKLKCSAQQHIRQMVVKEAAHQLRYSSQSIGEIGYNLGFKYPHHFTRVFKQEFGVTPNEYRNQVLQNSVASRA
jgi:AraC-like DNA-binding protein